MKIGLFFGSFNPVHIGHMIVANYMLEFTDLDEVWFVVSPQNPLKDKSMLIAEADRLNMVNIAIGINERIKVSNVEFALPQPSYTIDTLNLLKTQHPNDEFVLLMGTDNLNGIYNWKESEKILNDYKIYAYSRPNTNSNIVFLKHENVQILNANLIDLSSTFIRQGIKDNKDLRYMVPAGVWQYIKEKKLYE